MLSWAHLWQRLAIDADSQADEMRILRLHLLHLLQTVSYNSEDLDVGVPARGLHGEAYRGHVFWDELFIFPVLNLRLPTVTRSLLRYRYRRLLEARRAAKLAGYRGAMYPWQSGTDGREESPELHLNPRSGRWRTDPSHLAHHIGIAVAYNAWKFYQVTADLAYLIDYGAEMLCEIARFWVSRVTYEPERDRYSINGVIGPDEFHCGYPDRPYEGVDNNAYTNVMAVWVILRAMDALRLMPLPNRLDLREKLGLTDKELSQWDHVSRRMFVPFHDGVISQFEGYEQLAELDWDAYRERYGNIQRLDRILEAEEDDVNRYKASKQADALMLLYLMSSDELRELLDRLDYHFSHRQIPKMVDYYMDRTSHGSTLSTVVHTWVLARANRDHAMEFFEQALNSDITDIQGGTTSEGIHLAAMAGSVDLVQRCFTGLETRQDRIILSPHWPESAPALGFPIHYRGHRLYLRVSGKGAEVSADPRDVPPIEIECHGRVERLGVGKHDSVPLTGPTGTEARSPPQARQLDRVDAVGAAETFQLDFADRSEREVVLDRVVHRLAHQDLAALGLGRHPSGHRDVAAEQVVTASHGLAHVDADAHTNVPVTHAVHAAAQCALDRDAAPHRLVRVRERDHEPITLALDDVTGVFVDQLPHQLVVAPDQRDPRAVTHSLVQRGRVFDVGKQDHHDALPAEPAQVRPLDFRPLRQLLDRAAHGSSDPGLEEEICSVPECFDHVVPTTRVQRLWPVDVTAQFVGFPAALVKLPPAASQQHPQRDKPDTLDDGDPREHPDQNVGHVTEHGPPAFIERVRAVAPPSGPAVSSSPPCRD